MCVCVCVCLRAQILLVVGIAGIVGRIQVCMLARGLVVVGISGILGSVQVCAKNNGDDKSDLYFSFITNINYKLTINNDS